MASKLTFGDPSAKSAAEAKAAARRKLDQSLSEFDVNTWPPELHYRWAERVGIKMDSHTPQDRAEKEAMRETWAIRHEVL